jgi:hypothetical protein
MPKFPTSVPGGNGIVVGSGPGGFSKYDALPVLQPAMAAAVAVAFGVVVGEKAVDVG